jgi:hypothetical protein
MAVARQIHFQTRPLLTRSKFNLKLNKMVLQISELTCTSPRVTMTDHASEDSEGSEDSDATVAYHVVNSLASILQEMKLPNSVKQRANDLLIVEGFYAIEDVRNVSQQTWDDFLDQNVHGASLFNALEFLRPAETAVKIKIFRRRPGWTREMERGIPWHAIDPDSDRESSPPRRSERSKTPE